ncbi:MAG: HD family phosphohydrolase [Bacteroidia bacterium]
MFKQLATFFRNQHETLQRILLFIITAFIIVLLLPAEGKFKYEYQKSKPWKHDNLVAPYSFPINKTAEELDAEVQTIKANTKLYFRSDSTIAAAKIADFRKATAEKAGSKGAPKISEKEIQHCVEVLENIYAKGIIRLGEELENKDAEFVFQLVEGNESRDAKFGEFYTIQAAYNQAQENLKGFSEKEKDFFSDLLANAITHNIFYDRETTSKILEDEMNTISRDRGMVEEGVRIIAKGDIVDNDKFQKLESLRANYETKGGVNSKFYLIYIGHSIIIGLALLVLYLFLVLFRKQIAIDNLKVTFLLLIILLMVFAARMINNIHTLSVYIVPFSLLPVIVRTFFDTRVALFTHLVTTLIIGYFVPNGYQFVFLQLMAGIVSIFSFVNMQRRVQLFLSAGVIFITYCMAYFAMSVVQEGNITTIDTMYFAWFGISVLLTLFAYPLIFIFEKIFGFVSEATLLELSNTNGKLLRELATKAPGTFQHSLQVANLTESALFQIGGNVLLARTGALYHDIGKMDAPSYFIENQVSGVNPHDELQFDESAHIIINHVLKGIEKAKKANIPDSVIDFIRTHHGTTMVQYFYRNYLKNFPEEEVDKKLFTYPGPIPFSKETAVLMMADSVEAASRSLKSYTSETIDKLVDDIINHQVAENQFVNTDITFRDITQIKKIFKKKLANIYHVRIEYPK